MKKQFGILTCSACVCALTSTSQAGVTFSVDGSLTGSSAAWSGTPAVQGVTPVAGTVPEGGTATASGGVIGLAFLATSSFSLGELKFKGGGIASSVISLSLYDLGTTTPTVGAAGPGPAPFTGNIRYTTNGSSVDLFSTGLSFTYASASGGIISLAFSDADQVALTAGNWYVLELWNNNPATNLTISRGGNFTDNFMALGVGETGDRYNVPAGNRTTSMAIYAVPEPTSAALLGLGTLIGTFAFRRRN